MVVHSFQARIRVASQPLLAGLLDQPVIEVLHDPFAAAQLGNTILSAQSFQYDADLVLCREVPPRRMADVLHHLCR